MQSFVRKINAKLLERVGAEHFEAEDVENADEVAPCVSVCRIIK